MSVSERLQRMIYEYADSGKPYDERTQCVCCGKSLSALEGVSVSGGQPMVRACKACYRKAVKADFDAWHAFKFTSPVFGGM